MATLTQTIEALNGNTDYQTETGIAGENITKGELCYYKSDNRWYRATSTDVTKCSTELRIATETILAFDVGIFMVFGQVEIPSAGLTAGDKYYVGETLGTVTNTPPTNPLYYQRYVGTARPDDIMLCNPDATYIKADGTTVDDVSINGEITASAVLGDNKIIRGDGGVKGIQDSGIDVDDSNNITGITSLTTDSLKFELAAGVSVGQGEMAWNADEETFDFGLNGAVLQGGQEVHYHVRNNTGVQIDNGKAVMATGTVGASGRITVGLMDGSSIANAKFFLGITTEDIADGTDGKVTFFGKVRGIVTTGIPEGEVWNEGDVLWVDNVTPGNLTNVEPTTGTKLPIAFIITKHGSNGTIAVRATDGTYFKESHDVDLSSPTDEDYVYWNNASSEWQSKQLTGSVTVPESIILPFTFPENARTSQDSLHGGLLQTGNQSGIILNSGTPITDDIGISKLFLVINAGSDLVGDITITGDSVDRNSGVVTPADSDVISITALTTDTSTTDANGNTVHGFTGGYITSKWFKGPVTLSTADVNLTDIDVWQVAFDQFNDSSNLTIDTLDATYLTENTSAEMDCYLYSVEVSGSSCDIVNLATLTHETGQEIAFYRKRIGNINRPLDGGSEGVFLDVFLLPATQTYFNSFAINIWATKTHTLSVTFS